MQLIVNIDKKVYRAIKAHLDCGGYYNSDCFNAIWNGVPIPEGHGRLIDADKLRAEYTKPHLVGYDEVIEDIDRQPTVVEGDGIWSDNA
jgi:hypothetical protein